MPAEPFFAQQLALFDDVPEPAAGHPAQPTAPPLRAQQPGTATAPGAAPAPAAPPASMAPSVSPAQPTATNSFTHPRAQREIVLEGHRVAYALRRARRRTIGFVISEQGLTISAPRWVGQSELDSALREKSRWIVRKLQEREDRTRRMEQTRIVWRDGTSVPFLGETVIVVMDPRTSGAVLNSAADALPGVPRLTLHVGLPHTAEPEQLREAVQSWLQRQARRIFEERCAAYAQRLKVQVKRISLSSASTRWGSASADGSIRLNWRLVHFGLPVIDYVVAHELAHLREMNHSDAFWDVVRSVMPDYEHARGRLKDELLPAFE